MSGVSGCGCGFWRAVGVAASRYVITLARRLITRAACTITPKGCAITRRGDPVRHGIIRAAMEI